MTSVVKPFLFFIRCRWILDKKCYICNVFETEIKRYDELVAEYQEKIVLPMGKRRLESILKSFFPAIAVV